MGSIAAILDVTPHADLLRAVGQVAARENIETYLVGGSVRDALLDRPTTDIDFVSVGNGAGLRLATAVQAEFGGSEVHRYENFGTAAIRIQHGSPSDMLVLEFVGARKESYDRHSRKPAVESGSMEDDQHRRDFTINALAVDIHPDRFGTLVDSFGGIADLNAGIIRTPLDPETTFEDDPLRIIRAARFACQLGFEIDPITLAGMRIKADRVTILSGERISDELNKILCANTPSVGFRLLYETGVLHHLLPDLVALQGVEAVDGIRHKDNFFHTLKVVDNLVGSLPERPCPDTLWLRWAALLHDIGKTSTKRFTEGAGWSFHGHEEKGARMVKGIFRRLRLPVDERMKYVQQMIRLHHRPVALVDDDVTDSAVRRLLFDAGEHIDDLMSLVRADITSKNPRRVRRYLNAFDSVEEKFREVEEKDHLRAFQPPVDGAEIMTALELPPSPAVGVIKNAIREAILDGKIPNDHDAAYQYMIKVKDALLASLEEDAFRDRR